MTKRKDSPHDTAPHEVPATTKTWKRHRLFQVARPASHFASSSSGTTSQAGTRSATLRLHSNGRLGHRKKDKRACSLSPHANVSVEETIADSSPLGSNDDGADTTAVKAKKRLRQKNTSAVGVRLNLEYVL
jgi:hypothetical protein